MTARFGRNKRRAAREAVAKAEAAAAAAKAETASTRDYWQGVFRKEERARQEAQQLLGEICERIARGLGEGSALIPLKLQKKTDYGTPIRWPIVLDADIDGWRGPDPNLTFYTVQEAQYADLHRLVMKVTSEEYRGRLATLIRFVDEIERTNGMTERAYMASDDTLRKIGLHQDLRFFVEDVVRQMLVLRGAQR